MAAEREQVNTAPADTAAEGPDLLDQALLDELVAAVQGDQTEAAAAGPEQALGPGAELDEPLVPQPREESESPGEALQQADFDAELVQPKPDVLPPAAPSLDDGQISQDFIDALVAAAGDETKAARIVGDAPVVKEASPPPVEGLLTQEELDKMVEQAIEERHKNSQAKQRAFDQSLAAAAEAQSQAQAQAQAQAQIQVHPKWRVPLRLRNLKSRLPVWKTAVTITAAIAVGVGVFLFLSRNTGQLPAPVNLPEPAASALVAETPPANPPEEKAELPATPTPEPVAPEPVAEKPAESSAAPETPEPDAAPLPGAAPEPGAAPLPEGAQPESPKTAPPEDPALAHLGELCKGLDSKHDPVVLDAALDAVNQFLESHPTHAELSKVLKYKAVIYEQKKLPYAAFDLYRQILNRPAVSIEPEYSNYLQDGARTALQVRHPQDAVIWMERYTQQFPDNPKLPDAELLLARAYSDVGRVSDSSAVYAKLMQTQPATPYASQSAAALAQVALDQARYEDAVKLLAPLMVTLASEAGGDLVRLNLARAYRGAGRIEDARKSLEELVAQFPESAALPDAYCELVGVLQQLGLQPQALQLAKENVERYPRHPKTLRMLADLLGKGEDKKLAAETLLKAGEAGGLDPEMLLTAARNFAAANATKESEKTYRRVIVEFPRSQEAFEAKLELAARLCGAGNPREGIATLEELAKKTENTPRHLPVLLALGNAYKSLGFDTQAADAYRRASGSSAEPEVLAQSATALLEGGAVDDGLQVAGKVDLTKVSPQRVVPMLSSMAKALVSRDAPRAAQTLEQVRNSYPTAWNDQFEMDLLKAYIAAKDDAGAQVIVERLGGKVAEGKAAALTFRTAVTAWADYLMEQRRYSEAADAYKEAVDLDRKDEVGLRAQYQRGNALMRMEDTAGALAIFDEIAASTARFAGEAALKASQIRIEMRLLGMPVKPKGKG